MSWSNRIKGDLQMHTLWSDGSASIREMAESGEARGYEYIAITDHSKGLRIAGGINEEQLEEQGSEIAGVNAPLEASGHSIRGLRSLEVNLSPTGENMSALSINKLDLVWVVSIHRYARRMIRQSVTSLRYAILLYTYWDIRAVAFITFGSG
jgi:DNA polymerase (family 10)